MTRKQQGVNPALLMWVYEQSMPPCPEIEINHPGSLQVQIKHRETPRGQNGQDRTGGLLCKGCEKTHLWQRTSVFVLLFIGRDIRASVKFQEHRTGYTRAR